MVAMSGLSVEALTVSSDEDEVVVRTLGNYDEIYTLTGKLMRASGLRVNSLVLKKSRHFSLIETTIVLTIVKETSQ
jgi:hypothetical protein